MCTDQIVIANELELLIVVLLQSSTTSVTDTGFAWVHVNRVHTNSVLSLTCATNQMKIKCCFGH